MGVNLFEPLHLGGHIAPNRIIFGPHETNLGNKRSFSNRHVEYYRRRIRSGVGILITEEASVHPIDWPYERAPLAKDCAAGWAEIAALTNESPADASPTLVLAALGHAGGQGTSHWSQRELWAPSNVPEVNTREVPKSMEPDDIAAVVSGFEHAAALAVGAGCAGVEINIGQYSLLRQFLSGLTNHRDDEWGADRTKIVRDVFIRVRRAIGDDNVLAIRFSGDELAPWAGITPESAAPLLQELLTIDGGRVDLVTVVKGSIYSTSATRPTGHTAPGFNIDLCRDLRTSVHEQNESDSPIPFVLQGSIVDPGQAEWAAESGVCDAVEMTRAQIADGELVAKWKAGHPNRIRPCTLSNQRSQVRDNRNPIVSALGDPRSGHETEDPEIPELWFLSEQQPLPTHQRVLIIGGGPAGLEAARVGAILGHEVTIIESSDGLGGMIPAAAQSPGWSRLQLLVDWLESECMVAGVNILTEQRWDAEQILSWVEDGPNPEHHHVVLATGSENGEAGYDITRAANVVTAADFLNGDITTTLTDVETVAIWDPIGGPIGVGVAELIAPDVTVEFVTPDQIVGNELSRSGDLADANARLQRLGVQIHRRSVLRQARKGGVILEDRFTGEQRPVAAELLIDAGHRLPNDGLWGKLEAALGVGGRHGQLIRIGDCVAPRTIYEAILEARRAAFRIGL